MSLFFDKTEQQVIRHARVDLMAAWFKTLNAIRNLPETEPNR